MKPVIVFDSECSLCVRFKQSLMYLDKDKIFEFYPLQDETLFLKYPKLNKSECESEIHVLKSEDEVLRGADAVSFIITQYPQAKKFSWLIESESGQKAIGFFNDKVGQIRKTFKKNCPKCNKRK